MIFHNRHHAILQTISTNAAPVRCFDWIAKTSMYQDFKSHYCTAENEALRTALKDLLQMDFKQIFGLKFGYGLSNLGYVAKEAFARPDLFSQCTGVPQFIVQGISTVIQAIDCPQKICPDKYERFANEWLDQFHASDWSWSWLSPTVHMLFHHGAQILRVMPVSTSLLTGHVHIFYIHYLVIFKYLEQSFGQSMVQIVYLKIKRRGFYVKKNPKSLCAER